MIISNYTTYLHTSVASRVMPQSKDSPTRIRNLPSDLFTCCTMWGRTRGMHATSTHPLSHVRAGRMRCMPRSHAPAGCCWCCWVLLVLLLLLGAAWLVKRVLIRVYIYIYIYIYLYLFYLYLYSYLSLYLYSYLSLYLYSYLSLYLYWID